MLSIGRSDNSNLIDSILKEANTYKSSSESLNYYFHSGSDQRAFRNALDKADIEYTFVFDINKNYRVTLMNKKDKKVAENLPESKNSYE